MNTARVKKTATALAAASIVAALTVALLGATTETARADTPVEPQNYALGKSLGDWFERYSKHFSPYGGGPDHRGYYRYMPLPAANYEWDEETQRYHSTGEIDVSLRHNEGFFLPVNGYTGWEYLDGSVDPLLDDWMFVDVDVTVTLDGETFFDSDELDLADFYAEQYYSPPLVVDPDVEGYYADIFVQGVAFLCPPLPEGEHVLHLVEDMPSFALSWDNTWNITVGD